MSSTVRGWSPVVLRHMAACRVTAARNQRRWAQVHDVRFLATTQESRSVLEKYREKLDKKAREEGLPDIEALKKAYSDKIEAVRKRADAQDPLVAAGLQKPAAAAAPASKPKPAVGEQQEQGRGQEPKQARATTTKEKEGPEAKSGIKPLSSILKLSKASALSVPDLTTVWREIHSNNPQSLCAVVPSSTYESIEATAHAYPQFLLPVPHPEQGAELHFLQWTFDAPSKTSTVLFTQLAEYKNRGEFAQPHTTVTHYLDLKDRTAQEGVVLMHGQVMEHRGVTVEHAQWLVMCLQRFYGGWDGAGGEQGKERAEERRRLLELFGKGDERFSVQKLMEEAERMG